MKILKKREINTSCCVDTYDELILLLENLKAQVPEGVEARFEIESDWDSSEVLALFIWESLETADEYIHRMRITKHQRDFKENQELCMLEKLKEKYKV